MIFKVMKTVVYEYRIDCDDIDEALSIANSYTDEEAYTRYFSNSFMIADHEKEVLNA